MSRIRLLLGTALFAFAAPAAMAQQARSLTLADYLEWEDVQSPQLSPDGQRVIYTRRFVDKLNDRWENALWLVTADGVKNRFLVQGSEPKWSPDGTRIAYIARADATGPQIFVRWMDAEGATSQVTRLTEAPTDIEWAPDGRTIAFRMTVPKKPEGFTATIPAAPKGAKWVEAPRVVSTLDYRQDRQGFNEDGVKHIFVIPADGGSPRQVTSGNWDHGAPTWTPDGRAVLFSGLRAAESEYFWRESEIYRADVASGVITPLTTRKGPDANPVPSPDGKWIAYTGYDSTDATWKDAALYVMNADGSNPRALTASFDRSPSAMQWSKDGATIYFTAESEGTRQLWAVPAAGGAVRAVSTGKQVLSVSMIGASGLAVGVRATADRPNDIVAFNVATPASVRQLTDVNADVLSGKSLATSEEVWYTSVDGYRIQGWIVKPAGFDPSKKYPLMLEIHGGPHSMYNTAFSFARQEHAANGYVTLYTNPRGSTGYGSAFGNAIKNAYPGKDFNDLMAGVDTVINRGYIDSKRLYVYGCSGGGVLTSWIVGHTDRFAAASANCPVTNWMSFVGTTDSPGWYRNFAKPFWEDPSEYLQRSPIMYVGNVKTPTMLMTGVQDLRTPMPQTEEFYEALKFRKVPTMMVRFNEEWHGTSSRPSNFMRTQAYLRDWFGRWPAGGAKSTME